MHGDDFTAAGPKPELDWFEAVLKKSYELTVGGQLGPGPTADKETIVFGRVIRWTNDAIEYEADPSGASSVRRHGSRKVIKGMAGEGCARDKGSC